MILLEPFDASIAAYKTSYSFSFYIGDSTAKENLRLTIKGITGHLFDRFNGIAFVGMSLFDSLSKRHAKADSPWNRYTLDIGSAHGIFSNVRNASKANCHSSREMLKHRII